jgi:hypothetical protein
MMTDDILEGATQLGKRHLGERELCFIFCSALTVLLWSTHSTLYIVALLFAILLNAIRHHDIQHKDIQRNDTQHNDTQHKGT